MMILLFKLISRCNDRQVRTGVNQAGRYVWQCGQDIYCFSHLSCSAAPAFFASSTLAVLTWVHWKWRQPPQKTFQPVCANPAKTKKDNMVTHNPFSRREKKTTEMLKVTLIGWIAIAYYYVTGTDF